MVARLLAVFVSLLAFGAQLAPAAPAEPPRIKRTMQIHKLPELGLEVWTEHEPEWSGELRYEGRRPMFVVESPERYYPPAAMSYVSFPEMRVGPDELRRLALTSIQEGARNFGARKSKIIKIAPARARYGELDGYEAEFSGHANGEAVDVKMFVGLKPGKGPVAMYVYTLPGKLPHLSEQIRRAWQNVKYLD